MSLSGANIVDAKIQTTTDGMALDVFVIQDSEDDVYDQGGRMNKLRAAIEDTLKGKRKAHVELDKRRKSMMPSRTNVFKVEPTVLINNVASNIHTVIEVRGRDRSGLLADLTRTLFTLSLTIASAHISTFGERVVDVFYVKHMFCLKITNKVKIKNIEKKLIAALENHNGKQTGKSKSAKEAEISGSR